MLPWRLRRISRNWSHLDDAADAALRRCTTGAGRPAPGLVLGRVDLALELVAAHLLGGAEQLLLEALARRTQLHPGSTAVMAAAQLLVQPRDVGLQLLHLGLDRCDRGSCRLAVAAPPPAVGAAPRGAAAPGARAEPREPAQQQPPEAPRAAVTARQGAPQSPVWMRELTTISSVRRACPCFSSSSDCSPSRCWVVYPATNCSSPSRE